MIQSTAQMMIPGKWLRLCGALYLLGCTITAQADNLTAAVLSSWLADESSLPAELRGLETRERWPEIYASRDYQPLWLDWGAPNGRAWQLISALGALPQEGIEPPPGAADLGIALEQALVKPLSFRNAALLELRLTEALATTAEILFRGATRPAEMDRRWYLPERPAVDAPKLVESLERGVSVAQALAGLLPALDAYRRLRVALADYRRIAAAGGWSPLAPGPTLRLGDIGPEVAALRRRLAFGTDPHEATEGDDPALFDAGLETAVKGFQLRHGLDADGAVGARTRDALNIPVEQRIAQLRSTMERWRWLPREQNSRFVLVNTAGFRLELYEAGRPSYEMRVIVGQPRGRWSTPSFSARIEDLVLNPTWNIPNSILREEIKEKVTEDADYLTTRSIWAIDADGNRMELSADQLLADLDAGEISYRLRQDAGRGNALGKVKLILPNPFGIYLHDTTSRKLFSRTYRGFSHGCIRLEQPFALAAKLLGGEWDESRLERFTADAGSEKMTLTDPVPIYIVYLTAWVDSDGAVQFRDDHYRRDRSLLAYFKYPSQSMVGEGSQGFTQRTQ